MQFQAPRGTHDVLPGVADPQQPADERIFRTAKWLHLEATFRDLCARFGVEEIRTPIFEDTELFHRSVGTETDIVSKETYDFTDRSDRPLTLRPEGTAPVMRAIVEHGLGAGGAQLLKLAYVAPIFRYEAVQRGRYRQHHQVGIEYVGGTSPAIDVEVIALGWTYLHALGLRDLTLQINSVGTPISRPRHRDALLDYLRPHLARLSPDSQRRSETNPLRVLDSKDERDQEILAGAPLLLDYLEDEARAHFEAVQAGLTNLGIPFVVNGRLVRGLDYYRYTAFEVVSAALGSQNVVLGGGRYDGLIEQIGGPATPGVGFGSGLERALLILEQTTTTPVTPPAPQVWLVARSETERSAAQRLALQLRLAGVRVDLDLQGRSMKAQMRSANHSGASYAAFLRDDLPAATVSLKDLGSGGQQELPYGELAAAVGTG
ncbi:MAG: histidine--tRNA ligase [Fimbriimonadaceae bacterium]|nr:histidine--tRNA ligase [Fimbriimonadaceae bacterium]